MSMYCGRLEKKKKREIPPIHSFPNPWSLWILILYPYVTKDVIKDIERLHLAWIVWEALKTITGVLIRKS